MIFNSRKRKLGLATGIIAGSLLLAACDDGSMNADLRVIHASADAPPVNVRVGKKKLISDLDYAESSGYVAVRSGTKKVAVEAIIPGGNANVIEVKRFKFNRDTRYNILAINETADIAPLVIEESAAEPALDEVAIAVVHASTAADQVAKLVDVYVTAPDVDLGPSVNPNFSFGYEQVVDAKALPVATYRIRVTLQNSKDPVFDSGPVDLSGFAGDKLLIAALNSATATEKSSSPIKLLVANDITQAILLDQSTGAGARAIHLSPNADSVGPVEVFAISPALSPAGSTDIGSAEVIDAFSYTQQFPTNPPFVPAGSYTFAVGANGAVSVDTNGMASGAVYTSPELELTAGMEYSVIAAGFVFGTDPDTGAQPPFRLLATSDNNRAVVTQASVKVVHAAPAAGLVNVYVTPGGTFTSDQVVNGDAGDPLLENFAFGDIEGYVAVPPNDTTGYDIRVVTATATPTVVVEQLGVALPAGLVATVIARQGNDAGAPTGTGLEFLTNL